jgi:ATP-dependent Clp protease ATP-binding subunit ClpA
MASRAINSSAVSVINAATRTIGDNRRVELSQTGIFLTSNLGGGETTELQKFEAEWHG